MPSVEEARNLGRVQGRDSSLADLVLSDGDALHLRLGARVAPGAKLTRTIDGGSSVELTILDHDLDFLEDSLLGEKFDCRLDGMHFRWMGADLRADGIGITLKDRDIAVLEEQTEPLADFREDMTRARFIVNAVRSVRPEAKITCPDIDVIQPIETERQGRSAKKNARANKGKGLGDHTTGLEIKGEAAKPPEIEIGERAIRTAASRDAPFRVVVAAMAALIVESGLGRYSHNYMEIEPGAVSGFKRNPNVIEEAVAGFLEGYEPAAEGALEYFQKNPNAEPFEIAQAVQRSSAGAASNGQANYGPVVAEAREWVDAFEGGEYSGVGSAPKKAFKFELCTKQSGDKNWWEGIKRLAKEVNWRAFWVSGRFFYIDEIELFKQQVRLAINRDTPGVQSVIGPWRANRKATELTVTAFASHWPVPPGGVCTVAGYGPFSIGFGQAPLEKGQVGISGNRKAATKEGRARYLLETLEIPLRDADTSDLKLVTARLRKPTAPLPEPAAQSKSVSAGSTAAGSAGGNQKAQQLHDWCERQIGKPYVWGAVGPDSYDCSGFVSAGLMKVGLLGSRLTTSTFATYGEPGEGEFITIHDDNTTGNSETEHIIIEVLGDLFECGGVSGGVGKPPAGYERGFPTKRHPKGF
jgi:NlpC/P60 family protein